ncbi:MAG: VanW family protein [Eubacteriales bacterium]|nr:VanW family protein [Eubacteriales bacterium]
MSQGKFSSPRPHREEEREIEKAYRDLTRKKTHKTYEHKVTAEDVALAAQPLPSDADVPDISIPNVAANEEAFPTEDAFPEMFPNPDAAPEVTPAPESVPSPEAEDRQIEEAFRQVTGQSVKPRAKVGPTFDAIPEEPEEEKQESNRKPQWLSEVVEFCQQNSKLVAAALCAVSVMVIVCVILLFARSAKDPYGEKILSNVYIGDINVGGMSKKEAVAALNEAIGDVYTTTDMVIDLSGTQLRITPKDSGASFDASGAVEEAYAYGRTGTQEERDEAYQASKTQPYNIALLSYLNLKTDNIRSFLAEKAGNSGSTLVQTTYGLEGTEPELSTDKFNENAPTQTLVITLGKPGVGFDPDEVYDQVLDAYSQRTFLVTVEDVETLKDPDPIDLEKLYKEFYIAPVNAAVDAATGKTTPGSYGYEFDKEAAQKLLDEAEFGEEVRIPMRCIEPDILDASGFYADTLGEYQTRATGSDERLTNLRLACDAINGRVLNPGESLNFQDAVGSLSTSRGFKSAAEDIGQESTPGGGVTQVSSTLYCAALLSDLTVSSRSNLSYLPSFIKEGFDADTSLTIRNSLSYPVRISAQYSGGYVRVSIAGTEERDYYRMLGSDITKTIPAETEFKQYAYDNAEGIRHDDTIQEGRDGYQVKSYSVRYDKSTDQKLTSDYITTSNYAPVSYIYAVVEEPETEPPTQAETEPPTESWEDEPADSEDEEDFSGAEEVIWDGDWEEPAA